MAENAAVQPPEPGSSGELLPVTEPSVQQAVGGVPADLSSRSVMLLGSGGALSSIPSTQSGAPNTGT